MADYRKYYQVRSFVLGLDRLHQLAAMGNTTALCIWCDVRQAVDQTELTDMQRLVLYLLRDEQRTVMEISAIIDRDPGTVSDHLKGAILRIQHTLLYGKLWGDQKFERSMER